MTHYASKSLGDRRLVGWTEGAKKRWARTIATLRGVKPYMLYEELRVGQRLRPCPGCWRCVDDLMAYGSFLGGDPRDFEPDPECSTDAERARHAADCAAWDRGEHPRVQVSGVEYLPAGMYKDRHGNPNAGGYAFVERAAYGLGITKYGAHRSCNGSGVLPASRATGGRGR